jgi:pimeloyl-ACP methyl ester carboxylesterase
MADDWVKGIAQIRQFAFLQNGPFVGPGELQPDGFVDVGWDQNRTMPAYRVGDELVPFTPLGQVPPIGSSGDWRVDAFTDEQIKLRWRQADEQTKARIRAKAAYLAVPHEFRATGGLDRRGRIDPHGEVDLRQIRRPAFFGLDPWNERIAEIDARTSIVEFEVPREPHETIHLGLSDPIRLRGWHIVGEGVPDGAGGRVKALIVLTGGRSIETTVIQHPDDPACARSKDASGWIGVAYPDASRRTEGFGGRPWRTYLLAFARAGFDVLTLDKRGHGVSGGANDSNTNEQAEDIFRFLDAMESGKGARILTPDGRLLEGDSAAGALLGGQTARNMPVFLSGASQGCMVSCWAMHKNFVGDCNFERPDRQTRAPYGYNVKAALLLAPFGGGLGYRTPDDSLIEAFRRVEMNVQMMPTGEVLAGVRKWPALLVGRGLWDFAESLEGTFDCFRRCDGPRMIVPVRGPHGEGEWGAENTEYLQGRMIAFTTAAIQQRTMEGYSEPKSLRDLVASAPPIWPETARFAP